MRNPYSIKIFLPGGDPDGLRIIEKSNWSGVGIMLPRLLLGEGKQRKELLRAGVYVLYGPPEASGLPRIYVGEGDPIRPRLEQHAAKRTSGRAVPPSQARIIISTKHMFSIWKPGWSSLPPGQNDACWTTATSLRCLRCRRQIWRMQKGSLQRCCCASPCWVSMYSLRVQPNLPSDQGFICTEEGSKQRGESPRKGLSFAREAARSKARCLPVTHI